MLNSELKIEDSLDSYEVLNEKCDLIINKIKSRKRKIKTTSKNVEQNGKNRLGENT